MMKLDLKQVLNKNQFVVNYRRMWPFVKPFWPIALLSLLICIPVGSLDAVIALFLKPYTDIVVVGKSMESPWYIPLLIVGFTTVQGLLNFGGAYLNAWVGGKLTMGLKSRLYKKLVEIEPSFFDKTTSGEVLFRFNSDAELACSGLLGNLKSFLTRICSSIALIGVLFYNSWQLSILAIVILVVAVAPLTKVKKLLKSLVSRNNTCMFQLNTTYNETFSGNRTIAAYNLQERQKERFNGLLDDVFTLTVAMTRRTAWITPFMHFVISIGLGLAIALGSWLIVQGSISAGNFVSFITALLMLYTPLKNITNVAVSVQQSFLAIERVFSLLERPCVLLEKEHPAELSGVKKGVTFEHVSFCYNKHVEVLHDINLDVRVGEMLALVGNSGGGKSTLVSLLPRFYDVTRGSIKVDGVDVRDFALNDLRQHIAMVFQDNFLFDGTIKENILLGNPAATDEDIKKALHNACLSDFIDSLEKGVETYIGERGILLSGGQKQRVAIARAFLKNAPIVILDEATSALDNKSEEIVQRAIDNLMKDKTVFVIAHRLSTVKNANRIAVINEGRLVELGSHEELMAIPNGQYRTLYNMQFKAPAHHAKEEKPAAEVA
ncbi:ABC transporter transmembrane domain-containing protein [uncultured Mailhella sp.]|uniref:ABC transporter ATP-binding protein n=1 Tax=uncultured Mailhella sp. TaxID=1981031 RepID=UPI0025D4B901|nr:ABC transporter transmembrane domain-containing protein [uncultured Mailhella sp.]